MKCRASPPGSLSASGEVNDRDLPESMDTCVLKGNELLLNIMQEFTPFPLWANVHYVRLLPWRYGGIFRGKFTYKGSFRGSLEDTHGRVLKHDSLIVEIENGKWIKAEKGGVEPEMNVGGIRVKLVTDPRPPEDWTDPGDPGPGRYSVRFTTGRIKLGNCKGEKEWTVGELRRLLKSCDDAKYNVGSANCWKYANSGAKAVLEWAKENAVDEQVKTEVEKKLKELATLERPMPLQILLALWNPHTKQNQAVLEQFLRKLSGTLTGLPENSYLRRLGVRALTKVVGWRLGRDTTVVTASTSLSSLEHEVGLHHSQPQDLVEDSRAPSVHDEAQLQDLVKDSALPEQNEAWPHDLFKDSALLYQDEQDLEIYPNLGSDLET